MTGRAIVPPENLLWSATVLLRLAADIAEDPNGPSDDSFFSQGADRSAARALPLLLLPAAADLRHDLGVDGPNGVDDLISLSGAIASHSANEARLAYARGLDAIWAAPCDPLTASYPGRCRILRARPRRDSYLESVFGPWDFGNDAPSSDFPARARLWIIERRHIYVRAFSYRAMGSAAPVSLL